MPYPNEHSARLADPVKFDPKSFRRTNGGMIYGRIRVPKTIAIIWGKLKSRNKPSDAPIPQALRFPTKYWSFEKAKKWLSDNKIKYIRFEPASGSEKKSESDEERITSESIYGFLMDMETELWAMEPRALYSFFSNLSKLNLEIKSSPSVSGSGGYRVENGIAHVAIRGILIKEIPEIFKLYGIEATSYLDIIDQIQEAIGDEKVKEIQLDVDSPGGMVNGGHETADVIRAARDIKPVTAIVDELNASGAYWLSSQSNRIIAKPTSMIGSIGVFTVYVDSSKRAEDLGFKVHIIKSAPLKGTGVPGVPISEDQLAAIQELIDGTAEIFINSVSQGRQREIAEVQTWATGQLFLAKTARDKGLIDEIYNVWAKGNIKFKENAMGSEQENEQVDAQVETNLLIKEVKIEERERLFEIKKACNGDLEFAMDAWDRGLSALEAKAEYADVLLAKLEEQKKETAKAIEQQQSTGQQQAIGAEAIAMGDTDSASDTVDFIAESKKLSESKGIGMTEAMRRVKRSNPGAYESFRERCRTQGHQMYAEAENH